jgi:regulatory protein
MLRLNIGTKEAFKKITQFCSYQERSHQQVKEKLYSFGLYKNEVEELISKLIEHNFLNEERYAEVFAGGKFRIKGWGKVKIKYELKQQGVSDYCIKKALSAIDAEDYYNKCNDLFEIKKNTLSKEKNIFSKRKKIQSYLLQKGYESSIINDFIKTL